MDDFPAPYMPAPTSRMSVCTSAFAPLPHRTFLPLPQGVEEWDKTLLIIRLIYILDGMTSQVNVGNAGDPCYR
jgi:hypothetical protein